MRACSRLILLMAALLFASGSLCAQQITDQKKAVAFAFGTVHIPNQAKQLVRLYAPLGTVFFVTYPDQRPGPDFNFFYLVTAKHVLKDADGEYLPEITVRMNLKETTGTKGYEDISHIQVTDAQKHLIWFHDTDDAVDVAALPFLPDIEKFDFKTLPLSMFVDDSMIKENNISEGDTAFFIGLMAQYYGNTKNHPVVRRGALALMTDEEIDTPTGRQKAFIAELLSWPGNSGSPVFLNLVGLRDGNLTLGMKLRFLGILSGSFVNKRQGTVLDTQTAQWGDEMNTGISFIIPASRVKAILESPVAQASRDAEVQRLSISK